MRKSVLIFIFCIIIGGGANVGSTRAQEALDITGVVETVAEDGTSIVIDGQTITTTQSFIEDMDILVGDKLKVMIEKQGEVLKAVDCEFLLDDDFADFDKNLIEIESEPSS